MRTLRLQYPLSVKWSTDLSFNRSGLTGEGSTVSETSKSEKTPTKERRVVFVVLRVDVHRRHRTGNRVESEGDTSPTLRTHTIFPFLSLPFLSYSPPFLSSFPFLPVDFFPILPQSSSDLGVPPPYTVVETLRFRSRDPL